ncbi:hypothetical protein HELRODRAFT_178602 [Helobdella robusta]|uniref:MULE transposase domain-containing protein n=1 Tax=Helobdella robusta TaxID=6412 RepID=T1FDG0_HELRO|nr:hypothetical protein HELRODRAFT_178602 [Helobdella robusta]ESN96809.1 hypothetical protein HELRODRAFT_178602 [Helobdella robusta]
MRRKTHHVYVTDRAVCNGVVKLLVEFLNQRFALDEETVRIAIPFAALTARTAIELKDEHKLLGCNRSVENIDSLRKMSLPEQVRFLASPNLYIDVATILARILAVKPHSADVERLISTSTTLMSIKSRLGPPTCYTAVVKTYSFLKPIHTVSLMKHSKLHFSYFCKRLQCIQLLITVLYHLFMNSFSQNKKKDSVTMDLVKAGQNAISTIFPTCKLFGCLFHFGKYLWRKVREENLTTAYREDKNVVIVKMLLALSFAPPEDAITEII